jgi:imidazoleglycerol-phosphate dehydratase
MRAARSWSFPCRRVLAVAPLDGMAVERSPAGTYVVRRRTREAVVSVDLDLGPRREPAPATGLAFFDHMLEMLSWYGGCTVAASYEALTYRLTHVICEDIGLALGAAFQAALRDRTADGVEGSAYAFGSIDEAIAFSHVSFEGRSGSYLTRGGAAANEHVEDMLAADLGAFFEGFAQGGRVTVHVRVDRADDPHHAWEAAFRAFAKALRGALTPNPWRAGLTAGVKGTLD